MIPPVPFALRAILTLALATLAFVLDVASILVGGLGNWITPELGRDRTSERSEVSNREPKP